jgi:DNA-binding transcriptional regulator/RsmH inhibitor MraZ
LAPLPANQVSDTFQPYKGFKSFKMDPKFRVSIPSAWRPEAGALLFLMYSQEHDMPLVKVLSQAAYDERVERVRNSSKPPAVKDQKLGKLAMLSRETTLNEQGKLLVPKDLSEMAGIAAESEVMLAGRGLHFEIWSKANFAIKLGIEMSHEEDDDLGIY